MPGREHSLPKQNRPIVRGGRLQPKKRTDRTYLSPRPAVAEPATDEESLDAATAADSLSPEPAAAAPGSAAAPPPAAAAFRVPSSVRAIQQQGVRKRREVDVHGLVVRDTKYALHELRRIAVLATMVIVTLIVLGIVLR
jgi:hypothetical protein